MFVAYEILKYTKNFSNSLEGNNELIVCLVALDTLKKV